MKNKIEYSVILGDDKNPCIKHVGKSSSLNEAKNIAKNRKILPNQYLWIGKYVNGILEKKFDVN